MSNHTKNIPENGVIRKATYKDIINGAIVWIATIDDCNKPALVQLEVDYIRHSDGCHAEFIDSEGNSYDSDDTYILEKNKKKM